MQAHAAQCSGCLTGGDSEVTDAPTVYCGNPSCLGEPWCSAWGICCDTIMDSYEEAGLDRLFQELSQLHESTAPLPASPAPLPVSHSLTQAPFLVPPPDLERGYLLLPTQAPLLNLYSSPYTRPKEKKRLFAAVKTDREVQLARATGIPETTLRDSKYCIGVWEAWRKYRESENGDTIEPIDELNRKDLEYWLTRFILEVKVVVIRTSS